MLGPVDVSMVVDAIKAIQPLSPSTSAKAAWLLIHKNYDGDTGLVLLDREAIAAELEISAAEVSRAMTALERLGVVRRERVKGLTAPGKAAVRYYVEEATILAGELNFKLPRPPSLTQLQRLERLLRKIGSAPPALPKERSVLPDWVPDTAAARRIEYELHKRRESFKRAAEDKTKP